MRIVHGLLLMCAASLACAAEDPNRPKPLRELVDFAAIAPSELAAHALLQLVEGGKIADRKWRQEVLESAWNFSRSAIYQDSIVPAIPTHTDMDVGVLYAALGQGLSAAALQARVIRAMLPLDLKRARAMFQDMSPPKEESLTCSDAFVTSHEPYFESMRLLANSFTAKELQEGKRLVFVEEAFHFLATPLDFKLTLDFLLKENTLTNNDFSELVNLWSGALARANFDTRTYSRPYSSLNVEQVLALATQLRARGVPASAVLQSFRAYFVKHAHAARCAEALASQKDEEAARESFNSKINILAPDVPPIEPKEIKPVSFGDKAKIVDYLFNDPQIKTLRKAYAHLRFGTEEQQAANNLIKRPDGMAPYLTVEQRGTAEWNQEALLFLNQLESWTKEHNQPTKDLFQQKCAWYSAFLDIAPDGNLRLRVLDSYVSFLAGSPVEKEAPPQWFLVVDLLIKTRDVKSRKLWLERIESGGDATIVLFCKLARVSLGQ